MMWKWLKASRRRRTNTAGERMVVCPDCGGDQWLRGPEGGMSINVTCGGCGARFNYSPFGLERMNSPYKR